MNDVLFIIFILLTLLIAVTSIILAIKIRSFMIMHIHLKQEEQRKMASHARSDMASIDTVRTSVREEGDNHE